MNNNAIVIDNQVLKEHLIAEYKDLFEKSCSFMEVPKSNYGYIPKDFFNNVWFIKNNSGKRGLYINFLDLSKIENFTPDDILYFRCFIAKIGSHFSASITRRYYTRIKDVLICTSNFLDKDMIIQQLNTLIESITKQNAITTKGIITHYVNFLIEYELATNIHIFAYKFVNTLKFPHDNNMHVLPSSNYIQSFQYYLTNFFNTCTSKNLKNLYMPILIWWKLTTIIPMRISEFTYRLKPDCAYIKNGKYYIHITRSKNGEKEGSRNGKLPLITDFQINKEIYNLICQYNENVSFDKNRKCFISYISRARFIDNYVYNENNYLHFTKSFLSERAIRNSVIQQNEETFDDKNFNQLLNSFYRNIISFLYKDTIPADQRLTGNDTRYIAFMSLLLQGVSPIDIALMGGHITLSTQWSYIGNQDFYIDSEIIKYINSISFGDNTSIQTLKKIVFCMPEVSPVILADCSPADDNIGYCTATQLDNEGLRECNNCENCVFCTHYWCEPNNQTYLKLKDYITDTVLSKENLKLQSDILTFKKIFESTSLITIANKTTVNGDLNRTLKQLAKRIASETSNIINIKKQLIEIFPEKETREEFTNG